MRMAIQHTTYEMPIGEHAFDGADPIVGLHRYWDGALRTDVAPMHSQDMDQTSGPAQAASLARELPQVCAPNLRP